MLSTLMLMCELAKAMLLLWGLIMQNGLLTSSVVQYGTELRGQRLFQKFTKLGLPISSSLFLVPAHLILPLFFWGVRGFLACTGYWVKMKTHTYSLLLDWRLPWNIGIFTTAKHQQESTKAGFVSQYMTPEVLFWSYRQKRSRLVSHEILHSSRQVRKRSREIL